MNLVFQRIFIPASYSYLCGSGSGTQRINRFIIIDSWREWFNIGNIINPDFYDVKISSLPYMYYLSDLHSSHHFISE